MRFNCKKTRFIFSIYNYYRNNYYNYHKNDNNNNKRLRA